MSKEKIKLAVIFGGMSTESKVSILSAGSVLQNLDTEKYEITSIYITIDGGWYQCDDPYEKYGMDQELKNLKKIHNIIEFLSSFDVIFPVLHGLYGEDGTMQGMLELIQVPYVGCGVLASSVAMDKVYTKLIFEKAGLNQAKYQYIKCINENYSWITKDFEEYKMPLDKMVENIIHQLKFPLFVKPSNSGSSVGVSRAENKEQFIQAIQNAGKFDVKILIEEGIIGKEVECAVLGCEEVMASKVGQIIPAEFFS